jgi:thiol:disulfide interchange protein
MSGSLEINILSFLEKFFLYGSAIWLLAKAGLRLGSSTLIMVVLLFVTGEAERWLPNRSAEITDAVFALMIGGIFALIRTQPVGTENELRRK